MKFCDSLTIAGRAPGRPKKARGPLGGLCDVLGARGFR